MCTILYFTDAKTILVEEIVKTPCHRWKTTGECIWGTTCRNTHYSQEELWQLKMQGNHYSLYLYSV